MSINFFRMCTDVKSKIVDYKPVPEMCLQTFKYTPKNVLFFCLARPGMQNKIPAAQGDQQNILQRLWLTYKPKPPQINLFGTCTWERFKGQFCKIEEAIRRKNTPNSATLYACFLISVSHPLISMISRSNHNSWVHPSSSCSADSCWCNMGFYTVGSALYLNAKRPLLRRGS